MSSQDNQSPYVWEPCSKCGSKNHVLAQHYEGTGTQSTQPDSGYKYQSTDGLAQSNNPEFVDLWNRIGQEQKQAKYEWVKKLRLAGVRAARPDDGWVNREKNEVYLNAYPDFNDDPQVGDLIALGDPEKFRIVRVTGMRENRFSLKEDKMEYYSFQATDHNPETLLNQQSNGNTTVPMSKEELQNGQ